VSEEIPLCVVMPACDEEAGIEAALAELRAEVLDAVPGAQLVIVDDGSRDATGAILDRVAGADARVRVVHQANAGHGAALAAGVAEARDAAWLLLLDADREIALEGFAARFARARGHDALFGVRERRVQPWSRRVATRGLALAIRVLFGVALRDANAPFKLLQRRLWDDAQRFAPAGPLPSALLAACAKASGRDVVEEAVPQRARPERRSALRGVRLVGLAARSLASLLALRRALRAAATRAPAPLVPTR
jgi:glycosyltransferase involved in cell wall biosynthesis